MYSKFPHSSIEQISRHLLRQAYSLVKCVILILRRFSWYISSRKSFCPGPLGDQPPSFHLGAVSCPLRQLIYRKAADIKLSARPKNWVHFCWNIDAVSYIIKCGGGLLPNRACCCIFLKWNDAATRENLRPIPIKHIMPLSA